MSRQNDQIKKYLESNRTITARQAMEELGIYRLASRISELRQAGAPIKSQMIEVPTRTGEKTRIKEYWLGTEERA